MTNPEFANGVPEMSFEEWQLQRRKNTFGVLSYILTYLNRRAVAAHTLAQAFRKSRFGPGNTVLDPGLEDTVFADVNVAMAHNRGLDIPMVSGRIATLCTWRGPDTEQKDPYRHIFGYAIDDYVPDPGPRELRLDVKWLTRVAYRTLQEGLLPNDTTPSNPNTMGSPIGRSILAAELRRPGQGPAILTAHDPSFTPPPQGQSSFVTGDYLRGGLSTPRLVLGHQ